MYYPTVKFLRIKTYDLGEVSNPWYDARGLLAGGPHHNPDFWLVAAQGLLKRYEQLREWGKYSETYNDPWYPLTDEEWKYHRSGYSVLVSEARSYDAFALITPDTETLLDISDGSDISTRYNADTTTGVITPETFPKHWATLMYTIARGLREIGNIVHGLCVSKIRFNPKFVSYGYYYTGAERIISEPLALDLEENAPVIDDIYTVLSLPAAQTTDIESWKRDNRTSVLGQNLALVGITDGKKEGDYYDESMYICDAQGRPTHYYGETASVPAGTGAVYNVIDYDAGTITPISPWTIEREDQEYYTDGAMCVLDGQDAPWLENPLRDLSFNPGFGHLSEAPGQSDATPVAASRILSNSRYVRIGRADQLTDRDSQNIILQKKCKADYSVWLGPGRELPTFDGISYTFKNDWTQTSGGAIGCGIWVDVQTQYSPYRTSWTGGADTCSICRIPNFWQRRGITQLRCRYTIGIRKVAGLVQPFDCTSLFSWTSNPEIYDRAKSEVLAARPGSLLYQTGTIDDENITFPIAGGQVLVRIENDGVDALLNGSTYSAAKVGPPFNFGYSGNVSIIAGNMAIPTPPDVDAIYLISTNTVSNENYENSTTSVWGYGTTEYWFDASKGQYDYTKRVGLYYVNEDGNECYLNSNISWEN